MKFAKISENTFNELQTEAGILLNAFDPSNPAPPTTEQIICATTGGITATCVPTTRDDGEDVDNCPNNMLELKKIDSYEAKLAFTALSVTAETIRMSIGAADVEDGKITPRSAYKRTDFKDVWWVGDLSDGGFCAICLKRAVSTAGFSLKTTKSGKGNLSVELTGHYTLSAQDEVPMEFYIQVGEEEETGGETNGETNGGN